MADERFTRDTWLRADLEECDISTHIECGMTEVEFRATISDFLAAGPEVTATLLTMLVGQLTADYGRAHLAEHGPDATLRQLREDANTAAEGLKSMREKHYAVTQERDEARREICALSHVSSKCGKDPAAERRAAIERGWGYLYPEEVEL